MCEEDERQTTATDVAEEAEPNLGDGLRALPLVADDLYLQMQAFNLGVVDSILNDQEDQLLVEYYAEERTPISTLVVVSAIAQLWVFGLYELLRTWRQRVNQLLKFADELEGLAPEDRLLRIEERAAAIRDAAADPERANPAHVLAFERAGQDADFRRELREVLDRSELPFRNLEAVRMHLAKHEIPKSRGSYASAPGYTRIDEVDESISWQIDLGNKEVAVHSRRGLAEDCREFGTDESAMILPPQVQQQIRPLPYRSYGVKKVVLVLEDGTEREAFVAWNRQVLSVVGDPPVVDPSAVVDARGRQ